MSFYCQILNANPQKIDSNSNLADWHKKPTNPMNDVANALDIAHWVTLGTGRPSRWQPV